MTPTRIPAPGFAEPVGDAQRVFRAALEALARPTIPVRVGAAPIVSSLPTPPAGLPAAAGAILLALADESTTVWLAPSLLAGGSTGSTDSTDDSGAADLPDWIRFHTAAPIVDDRSAATFAVVGSTSELPPLAGFALGTDLAPHLSTTVIVAVPSAQTRGPGLTVTADGPGFEHPAPWEAPAGLPADFLDQWSANHAAFPRGVDLLFADAASITGLPRTTALHPAGIGTHPEGAPRLPEPGGR